MFNKIITFILITGAYLHPHRIRDAPVWWYNYWRAIRTDSSALCVGV